MANFGIVSGDLTIDGKTYCVSDLSVDYSTESLSFACMSSVTALKFPGQEEWSGSGTLAYEDDGTIDDLRGLAAELIFIVTTSTDRTITFTGDVVISSVNSSFSKNDVPTAEITFEGDGDLSEVSAVIP
jgi:hypothetical protein